MHMPPIPLTDKFNNSFDILVEQQFQSISEFEMVAVNPNFILQKIELVIIGSNNTILLSIGSQVDLFPM